MIASDGRPVPSPTKEPESPQRCGFTTGTCAAAAAKAAAMVLAGEPFPEAVRVTLPDGSPIDLPVETVSGDATAASAAVKKDAGDDPDVTHGCLVVAYVRWHQGNEIIVAAGDGVGTVTKPGLAVLPGEPAINPVPMMMIRSAIREVTDRAVHVTISIPGGKELAEKTFNPRLGVVGGLSILGTSGIVRPFSGQALRDALKCALSVAVAGKITRPVFVPGRIGERATRALFDVPPDVIVQVSNEWGFMLDLAAREEFGGLLVVGHPGKLAKLTFGDWDTHSSRSRNAVPAVIAMAEDVLGRDFPESRTVEGIFSALPDGQRRLLGDRLAQKIAEAVSERIESRFPVAVVLVNLSGTMLGTYGDLRLWKRNED